MAMQESALPQKSVHLYVQVHNNLVLQSLK